MFTGRVNQSVIDSLAWTSTLFPRVVWTLALGVAGMLGLTTELHECTAASVCERRTELSLLFIGAIMYCTSMVSCSFILDRQCQRLLAPMWLIKLACFAGIAGNTLLMFAFAATAFMALQLSGVEGARIVVLGTGSQLFGIFSGSFLFGVLFWAVCNSIAQLATLTHEQDS
jgi:hypothetical protein